MDEIKELGQKTAGNIHCLSIIGQIEGHQLLQDDMKSTKYEHVLPTIAAIEEAPEIDGLLILSTQRAAMWRRVLPLPS